MQGKVKSIITECHDINEDTKNNVRHYEEELEHSQRFGKEIDETYDIMQELVSTTNPSVFKLLYCYKINDIKESEEEA